MLTVLILFMGMIKVEIDHATSFEGPASRKMMLVIDVTTIFIGKYLVYFSFTPCFQESDNL